MTDALTLASHHGLNSLTPLVVVLGLLVSLGILDGLEYFIQSEICRIVIALKHVETNVARLFSGIFVIVEGDLFEVLDKFGLNMNNYSCCNHTVHLSEFP